MIRLWNHLVLSQEFIKKRRPEKRRLSEILDRSRLQASSVPSSRESLCLPENRRTEPLAPGDLHYSGPPNKGIKVCPEASVRYPLSGYDSPMESSSFKYGIVQEKAP